MTKLIYMEHMNMYSYESMIENIKEIDGKTIIILNETIFYPQGGGQPYDTGTIKNNNTVFQIEEVRYVDGQVYHIGTYESGSLNIGDSVELFIDQEKRILHTKLHSIGHLVDMALKELSIGWIPGKGYHFPNGPYVEYAGSLDGLDKEKLIKDLENKCNEIINRNIETRLVFEDDILQNGKPRRIVYYNDFSIPCGGTHIANLGDIGIVTIRKIKQEKENIRISY
jgi:Ser-tRNA(Ala) deacylase AlaX